MPVLCLHTILNSVAIRKSKVDDAPRVEIPREGAIGVWGLYSCLIPESQKLQRLVNHFLLSITQLSGQLGTDNNVVKVCMAAAVRAAACGTLRRGLLQGD
jgi:hypothetical protein